MVASRELPATAYAMLGLLSFGEELTGYDLKKWADHSLRFFYWGPAMAHVYRELDRLEALGLVVSRSVAAGEARNKRVFSITPDGEARLTTWLSGVPADPPAVKDQALLRIWMGHLAGRETLLAIVERQRDVTEKLVGAIRASIDATDDERFDLSILVEEFCERWYRARLDALDQLHRDLEAMTSARRART
jgi:DNA-binding PadR family transcriptional regulator